MGARVGGEPRGEMRVQVEKTQTAGRRVRGGAQAESCLHSKGGRGGGRPKAGGERGGAEALEGGLIPYTYVQSGPGRVPGLCCL